MSVEELRKLYKPGTKIKLIHMEDPWPVADNTVGEVDFVDDLGQIQMKWGNSSLALIPEVDQFEIISNKEYTKLKQEKKLKEFLSDYDYDSVSHYKPKKSDILIINNCSKSKDHSEELLKAVDRYKGSEIRYINDIQKVTKIDHYIISAKYGLISSEEPIPYYNKTFLDLTHKERKAVANKLHIREDLDNLLKKNNYKMVIVLLADVYLDLLELEKPFETDSLIFHFTVKNCKNMFQSKNVLSIPLNPEKTLPQFKKYIRVNLKAGIIKELFYEDLDLAFTYDHSLIERFIDTYIPRS